jgi:hypothetical protein
VLPPPPPPIGAAAAPPADGHGHGHGHGNGHGHGLGHGHLARDGDASERLAADPCQIVLQVARRVQLEHAVSVSVFV